MTDDGLGKTASHSSSSGISPNIIEGLADVDARIAEFETSTKPKHEVLAGDA